MRWLLPAVMAASVLGCFYPADRGKALEVKVDRLGAENAQLARELAETREKLAATLPKIDVKIAEVAKALDGLDKAAHRSDADIGIQFQKTVEDLASLRGQVETYLFKINELEIALKKTSDDTARRITELQGSEAVKAADAKKKADELKRPEDKKAFLQLADDKAALGELPLARQVYAEFLKKWPKDELTGEAHFGLGETFFSEEKCREALFEYGKVIQDFGKSASAPVAYLRSSECFKKLKMNDESRLALEELLKEFPRSDSAKTAKGRLAQLQKEKKPAPAPKKAKK